MYQPPTLRFITNQNNYSNMMLQNYVNSPRDNKYYADQPYLEPAIKRTKCLPPMQTTANAPKMIRGALPSPSYQYMPNTPCLPQQLPKQSNAYQIKNNMQIIPQQQKMTYGPSTSSNIAVKIKKQETQPSSSVSNSTATSLNIRFIGETEREKMFIFTGTVERVIKWNKIFQNHFCYFEVIAIWKGKEKGTIKSQNIILLKDRNKSPILQVIYYDNTPYNVGMEGCGQMLRCIGRMIGPNILNAISIRSATESEVDNLRRLTLICEQAVAHYIAV